MIQYLSCSMAENCSRIDLVSAPSPISSVMRSFVKKYSSNVSGRARAARMPMTRSHRSLSTPSTGMTAMGKTRATIIPETMIEAILLNTDRLPRCVVFRVDRATIRLWLIL